MLIQSLKLLKTLVGVDLKKRAKRAQILIIFGSLVETASLLLVIPIITIVSGNNDITLRAIEVVSKLGVTLDSDSFLNAVVCIYILIVVASGALGIMAIRSLSTLAADIGASLSVKLYSGYLDQGYSRFIKNDSSYYSTIITVEVARITDNILQPLAQINSRLGSGVLIFLAMLFYSPMITLVATGFFALAYALMYRVLRPRLRKYGLMLSEANANRETDVKDSLQAVKEIKIYQALPHLTSKFEKRLLKLSTSYSSLNILYNAPRYVIDSLIYLAFASLVLFSLVVQADMSSLLQYLVFFGMAALKLSPIVQQIYACMARIRGSYSVLEVVHDELTSNASKVLRTDSIEAEVHEAREGVNAYPKKFTGFVLNDLGFRYSETSDFSLNHVDMHLPSSGQVAFIGRSGSGKTTLADVISGLLRPSEGSIKISGSQYEESMITDDNAEISYVPQTAVIVKGSVAENIAFGIPELEINFDRVNICLRSVGLESFILEEPNSYLSVSSDNSGLSGGERQRLSIARALYHDADIIILDEPTSALDSYSEEIIVGLLEVLAKDKLIINVAHKLNTIRNSDTIYLLKEGKVVASGSYSELITSREYDAYLNEQ